MIFFVTYKDDMHYKWRNSSPRAHTSETMQQTVANIGGEVLPLAAYCHHAIPICSKAENGAKWSLLFFRQ
jgi:hypothetical protein